MTNKQVSTAFQFKKWTLFTLCTIAIVATVVRASVSYNLTDTYDESNNLYSRSEYRLIKSWGKTLIYLTSAISIMLTLMGLMGAYHEHYCLTFAYGIFMALSTLGSVTVAATAPLYWISTIFDAINCLFAFALVFELKKVKDSTESTKVIVMERPHAVVQVVPAQIYSPSNEKQMPPPAYSDKTAPINMY